MAAERGRARPTDRTRSDDAVTRATTIHGLKDLRFTEATGWHAARMSGVGANGRKGGTAVVVGDGAVGLCGVLATATLGAERVVAMWRHADRQALATTFGATDIVAERGAEGEAAIAELTGGVGADYVLEGRPAQRSAGKTALVCRLCLNTAASADHDCARARSGALGGSPI